jgi:hypothetical protein
MGSKEYERKLAYVYAQVEFLCKQSPGPLRQADTKVHARTSSESKLSTIQDFLDELENRKKIIIHERKEISEGGWTISLVQPLLFWSSRLLF